MTSHTMNETNMTYCGKETLDKIEFTLESKINYKYKYKSKV